MKVSHTHVIAPTQFVEAKGIRLAYRQFGKQSGVPSVFMQHFRGGLERGDPVVTDVLRDSYRRAILSGLHSDMIFGRDRASSPYPGLFVGAAQCDFQWLGQEAPCYLYSTVVF